VRGTALLLLLLLAAGCSSAHSATTAPPSTSATTSLSTVANPKLNEQCPNQTDGISAVPFTFPAGDGTKLLGLELGQQVPAAGGAAEHAHGHQDQASGHFTPLAAQVLAFLNAHTQ
jgi:hypothetical protein